MSKQLTPQELIERTLAKSTTDDCIVVVESRSQANLRWASSTLTTNGVIEERKVTVIAFVAVDGGMAAGAISLTDIAEDEIDSALATAKESAISAGKSEDAAELARDIAIGDWSAPHGATGPEAFAGIAPELGETFKKSVVDGIELFGYAEHTHDSVWIGSKGGMRLRFDQPDGRIEMTGKSHNRSRSTWEGRATRDFKNLSIAEVDAQIRQRLEWQGNKIEIPAGRYDTLAPSGAVADLYTYMLWMSAAKDAHEGRSVFSKSGGAGTRIGEALSQRKLSIFSDSTYKGLECSPFVAATSGSSVSSVYDNGQRADRVEWVKEGILNSLIQTRSSAALTGLPYTPFGGNFIIEEKGATGDLNSMISTLNSGLLITTFWYIRLVDPTTLLLTGLTRDGVYKVEGGEVVGTVNNFRWNDSPVELLGRIKAVGGTSITQPREWAGDVERAAAPAMIFEGFNMSTVSKGN